MIEKASEPYSIAAVSRDWYATSDEVVFSLRRAREIKVVGDHVHIAYPEPEPPLILAHRSATGGQIRDALVRAINTAAMRKL